MGNQKNLRQHKVPQDVEEDRAASQPHRGTTAQPKNIQYSGGTKGKHVEATIEMEHHLTAVSALNEGSNTDPINIDASPLNAGQQGQNRNLSGEAEEEAKEGRKAGHPQRGEASAFKVHLLVPVGTGGEGEKECVSVMSTQSYKEVLEEIHTSIGCTKVKAKPDLTYKFTHNRAPVMMGLRKESHWETLKEDYASMVKAHKSDAIVVFEILAADNYLEDLRHTLKIKAKSTGGTSNKKNAKSTSKLKNLNPGSDQTDEEEFSSIGSVTGLDSDHQQTVETLKSVLGPCQSLSCHNKQCKVNKKGTHVEIMWNLLHQWAITIVVYQKKPAGNSDDEVTEKKPPHFGSFLQFHSEAATKSPSPESITNPASLNVLGIPPPGGMFPFSYFYPQLIAAASFVQPHGNIYTPGGLPSMNQLNILPMSGVIHHHQLQANLPSSDSISGLSIPYPSIEEFFQALKHNPQAAQRNLDTFKEKIAEQKILFLDELKGMTSKDYMDTFIFVLVMLASWKVWSTKRFAALLHYAYMCLYLS
ncbi:hypothetical protein M422DRAFT_246395 [Sphaerobolus stellatus SS14]|nr:hypothetical protein M422DRAFT_246395 [Sphaerobolus stellatus SS14]